MSLVQLDKLSQLASKPGTTISCKVDKDLVQQSITYLASDAALDSFEIDPYWPKWNGPWWQMMLLHEMELTALIPQRLIDRLLTSFDTYFMKFFPFTEDEVPVGRDPLNQVACHCQLGTIHQLLTKYGVDVNREIPWISPWYLKYQLPDGGLNCDEAAYTRKSPKSSVVSTLPPLEAVLNCTGSENLSVEQIAFLDVGANYLMEKRLFRSSTTGRPIDESWLQLCFPRYYHYDILRGLTFLLSWSRRLRKPLPLSAIQESIEYIDREFPDGLVCVQRSAVAGAKSRLFDSTTSTWTRGPAATFPLLDRVSTPGTASPYLTELWKRAKADLLVITQEELVVF